jgi:excinuclease ABC subunit A
MTGDYLSGRKSISAPKTRRPVDPDKQLVVVGAYGNNLKDVTLEIPGGLLTCITGVSGSGKSTLINDTLYAAAAPAPLRLDRPNRRRTRKSSASTCSTR